MELHKRKIHTYSLDGDIVRQGINRDLTFSNSDRSENIRRVGEISKLFVQAGIVALSSFISPFKYDRQKVRSLFEEGKFIEVFIDCDLAECEKRDPKGLYKKARAGKISDFTGITSKYEIPVSPEIIISNGKGSDINNNVETMLNYLLKNKIIPPN